MLPRLMILRVEVMLSLKSKFKNKGSKIVVNSCLSILLDPREPKTARAITKIVRLRDLRSINHSWLSKSASDLWISKKAKLPRDSMFHSDRVN